MVERTVFPLHATGGWTVDAVLAEAEALRGEGRALVTFDAPIGLTKGYLEAVGASSFLSWLESHELVFDTVSGPDEWSVERPFVRPVAGGWTGVVALAGRDFLWRDIDRRTGAESVFKLIGANQVGRAAQELWRELVQARRAGRSFSIWPFEGDLDGDEVVVAEIYPRVAYAEVFGAARFAKSDRQARVDALTRLSSTVRVVSPIWRQRATTISTRVRARLRSPRVSSRESRS